MGAFFSLEEEFYEDTGNDEWKDIPNLKDVDAIEEEGEGGKAGNEHSLSEAPQETWRCYPAF